jgi:hypothetical protein
MNFGNVLLALQSYIKDVLDNPNALQPAKEEHRTNLRNALDAYIDARVDEKLKGGLDLGGLK